MQWPRGVSVGLTSSSSSWTGLSAASERARGAHKIIDPESTSSGSRAASRGPRSSQSDMAADSRRHLHRIEPRRNQPGKSGIRVSCVNLRSAGRASRPEFGFGKWLRVPDGKTRFLAPQCDERGVRRQEDEAFRSGHAQQQAVERIAVRLRGSHAGQDVFVGYR